MRHSCCEHYQTSKSSNLTDVSNLGQLRICAQRVLNDEDSNAITNIHKQASIDPSHSGRLRAAFIQSKLWPSKIEITYAFYPIGNTPPPFTPKTFYENKKLNPDPIQEKMYTLSPEDCVELIVNERIQPLVDLKFKRISDVNKASIRIAFDPNNGAWSLLGTDHTKEDKSKATMNFGWIDAMTIMHEFGHTLGMIHEHQNPRGVPIPWNKDAVYEWARRTQNWSKETTDTNILNAYDVTTLNGSNFDPESIMLYFFSPELTLNHTGTTINPRLSPYDVEWITKLYKTDPVSTAERFYQATYGASLKDVLDGSKDGNIPTSTSSSSDLLKNLGLSNVPWYIWYLIVTLSVLLLLIIMFIIVFVVTRKKKYY